MNNASVASTEVTSLRLRMNPLHILMKAWETEEEDPAFEPSETDLMIMLSGMPGQSLSLDVE